MNRNIRIARQLVRIARTLVSSDDNENYGYYSIDTDAKKKIVTVYFLPNEDAAESKAFKDANECRYEIKMLLEKDGGVEVTNLENNHKSFIFTIVVSDDEKKTASVRVADGEDDSGGGDEPPADEGGSGEDNDLSFDLGGMDDKGGDSDMKEDGDNPEEEPPEESEEDKEVFEGIESVVSDICKKHNWDTKK